MKKEGIPQSLFVTCTNFSTDSIKDEKKTQLSYDYVRGEIR